MDIRIIKTTKDGEPIFIDGKPVYESEEESIAATVAVEEKYKQETRIRKEKLGKLYNLIEKNEYLYGEDLSSIFQHFISMKESRKPVIEIDIHKHCKRPIIEKDISFCIEIGCDKCAFANKDIINKIIQLKIDLQSFGYYCKATKSYDLIVGNIEELVDIMVAIATEDISLHTAVRGLALGYNEDEIITYMSEHPTEVEIDWEIAKIVEDIISESIEKGVLQKDMEHGESIRIDDYLHEMRQVIALEKERKRIKEKF